MLLAAVVAAGSEYSAEVEQEANQANIGCVYSYCSNYADQSQTASANVVGGGSGDGSKISASVEQEANQANIGCVIAACVNFAEQEQTG